MKTVHLVIEGKVQDVFYRATAKDMADKWNISGWVKNTPLGQVEIMATGSDEQIAHYINWCHQGPSSAIVSNVLVADMPFTEFQGFEIKR